MVWRNNDSVRTRTALAVCNASSHGKTTRVTCAEARAHATTRRCIFCRENTHLSITRIMHEYCIFALTRTPHHLYRLTPGAVPAATGMPSLRLSRYLTAAVKAINTITATASH